MKDGIIIDSLRCVILHLMSIEREKIHGRLKAQKKEIVQLFTTLNDSWYIA